MIMVAEGLSYGMGKQLIECLKKEGIEANITVGGISLNPKISDVKRCKEICKAAGAAVYDGHSTTLSTMTLEGARERIE